MRKGAERFVYRLGAEHGESTRPGQLMTAQGSGLRRSTEVERMLSPCGTIEMVGLVYIHSREGLLIGSRTEHTLAGIRV